MGDLLSSLGSGAERKERPQEVVCYKAGDKIRQLEGSKETGDHLPVSMAAVDSGCQGRTS